MIEHAIKGAHREARGQHLVEIKDVSPQMNDGNLRQGEHASRKEHQQDEGRDGADGHQEPD